MKKSVGRFVRNAMTAKDDWKEINNKDGIVVHYKPITGSNIFAFRGQAIVPASVAKVCKVLDDNDGRLEWVDMIIKSVELERSNEHQVTYYTAFKPPFPVVKRDYVVKAEWTCFPNDKLVVLDMASTEHRNAPPTVGVRANLESSRYLMQDMGNGSTDVTVEIHTDPKGKLPKAIVNLIQREWPYKTLRDLRKFVAKAPDIEHPLILRELYEE